VVRLEQDKPHHLLLAVSMSIKVYFYNFESKILNGFFNNRLHSVVINRP
jgi:hypothetical protein